MRERTGCGRGDRVDDEVDDQRHRAGGVLVSVERYVVEGFDVDEQVCRVPRSLRVGDVVTPLELGLMRVAAAVGAGSLCSAGTWRRSPGRDG